jgi:hypothetical protein
MLASLSSQKDGLMLNDVVVERFFFTCPGSLYRELVCVGHRLDKAKGLRYNENKCSTKRP